MNSVEKFLACRRLAVVGVSQRPNAFSRAVFRALCSHDYDAVPVHPNARAIEDRPCHARVQDIQPPVECALVLTAPGAAEQVVRDCAAAGIRRVWLYRRAPAAETFCEANGIDAIAGECPLMFLPRAGWIHRLHGWFRKRRLVTIS